MPDGAVIVEIGSFMGCSTVLLAGGRKLRGSGTVHAIDPFDASGDEFSVPVYERIRTSVGGSLRGRFDANLRRSGLSEWVEVHQNRAADVAPSWTSPIDLLFLDGDQSYDAVRITYDQWVPFLKPGGLLVVHNSAADRPYHESHDGSMRLVTDVVRPPHFVDIRRVDISTFARRGSLPAPEPT